MKKHRQKKIQNNTILSYFSKNSSLFLTDSSLNVEYSGSESDEVAESENDVAKIELELPFILEKETPSEKKQFACPFYKVMQKMPFTVDAFKYGRIPGIKAYFLTHFHSDHYGGLGSSWDKGFIYCSEITARLLKLQLRVSDAYIKPLPMNETCVVEGVKVVLIDANHCPGAVLFLFELGDFRILHCGDFRACPEQVMDKHLVGKKLDICYLDTTYLDPKYSFPRQEDTIKTCIQVCKNVASGRPWFHGSKSFQQTVLTAKSSSTFCNPLIIIGTYSIGKEKLAMGIARAMNWKIFTSSRKREIFECYKDRELESYITSDADEANIHLVSLFDINCKVLNNYLEANKHVYSHVIGIRPTGWVHKTPTIRESVSDVIRNASKYDISQLQPKKESTPNVLYFEVPYSEHSSFRELACFCCSLNISKVIPTVNVGSAKSREQMKHWIDEFESSKRGVVYEYSANEKSF